MYRIKVSQTGRHLVGRRESADATQTTKLSEFASSTESICTITEHVEFQDRNKKFCTSTISLQDDSSQPRNRAGLSSRPTFSRTKKEKSAQSKVVDYNISVCAEGAVQSKKNAVSS
ncbi:hypothetical protein PMIN03_012017 [Paraphaeosphaeria minitans]